MTWRSVSVALQERAMAAACRAVWRLHEERLMGVSTCRKRGIEGLLNCAAAHRKERAIGMPPRRRSKPLCNLSSTAERATDGRTYCAGGADGRNRRGRG